MSATVILGLGNLVHTDDGVGVHAIEKLQIDTRVPGSIRLIDGGTLGLALLAHLSGVERLLVIDAVDAGEPPGTVMRFEGDALRGLPGKASIHQLGFADLMVAMELLGERPEEVVLLGVQPESTEWGAELTDTVSAVMSKMLDLAVAQVDAWCGSPALAH
jgi:hydrogenase maturation protease